MPSVDDGRDHHLFGPREFVAQGDTVVLGFERSLIKHTGRTFEQEWTHVYTLRDGKVAKFLALEDTAAHVVAFDATSRAHPILARGLLATRCASFKQRGDRAERMEETRRRITEAALELHHQKSRRRACNVA